MTLTHFVSHCNLNDLFLFQNFLICIEMFVAAVAHIYSFPHHPFHINSPQYWNNPNHNWCRAFLSMIDISDIQEDVTEHLGVVSSSISRRFQGRSSYQPLSRGPRRSSSESEYLINKRLDGDATAVGASGDASETGNKRKQYETNYAKTLAKSNRYGATDSLVLPVCDAAITNDYPSHSQLAGIRPTSSNATNSTLNQQQHPSAGAHSKFGIVIQKREPASARDYTTTHYGAPIATGTSFLQARNVSTTNAPSPIPESGDDFSSFIGSSR